MHKWREHFRHIIFSHLVPPELIYWSDSYNKLYFCFLKPSTWAHIYVFKTHIFVIACKGILSYRTYVYKALKFACGTWISKLFPTSFYHFFTINQMSYSTLLFQTKTSNWRLIFVLSLELGTDCYYKIYLQQHQTSYTSNFKVMYQCLDPILRN